MRRLAFVAVTPLFVGLSVAVVALHLVPDKLALPTYVVIPDPPVPPASNFPCIESALRTMAEKSSAALHGSDWKLETTINAACLTERDVTLAYEVSKLLVNRTIPVTTHMLVSRRQNKTFVRIVARSGVEQQDMIAVRLVTNQKCTSRKNLDCEIVGGPGLVRID